ncbi:MAG: hypothetical protein JW747_01765 [Candidatus Aminicenantes bacterium]|nr:hypothetical protein [Candidatus Aminicenantes bacterium]
MKRRLPPFVLGFLSLALQIVLLREFFVHFQGNEMTYGLLLASWLFWGGLGSLLAHRLKVSSGRLSNLFCLVLILSPACLAGLRLSRLALGILPTELTGPSAMSAFALALTLLVSFPLGLLFVSAVRARGGDAAFVYSMESLGAAAGGLAVHFLLVPHLSNWQVAGLVGLAAWTAVFFFGSGKPHVWLRAGAALAPVLLFFGDAPTQRLFWKPLALVATRDTPYGKLQVVGAGSEVTLYVNAVPVFSSGDAAEAEEAVHFALLQRPRPENVLLLGGGAGGGIEEALKHPGGILDYVELDPEIIRLSERILPPEKTAVFLNPRVSIHYRDGRAYLAETPKRYDAILLNLPEPSTAQLNRYYTLEFFQSAARRLAPDGVLSFRIPSSEIYISPARARYLASLRSTLSAVFPETAVVPGTSNIFLASRAPLSLDAEALSREGERRGLRTTYVRRELLEDRLNPMRVEFLRRSIDAEPARINTDLVPLCYYYANTMWAAHFSGPESRLLEFLSRAPRGPLVGLPLILGLLVFLFLRLRASRRTALLAPLALLGFSGIAVEVFVVLRFQTLYGAAYGSVALLLAFFMAGLGIGSRLSRSPIRASRKGLLLCQAALTAFPGLAVLFLPFRAPKIVLFLALFLYGAAGGAFFVQANRLTILKEKDHGTGYGLDLLGSFLGAAAVSTVFLPLAGLMPTALLLLGLNLIAFLFLSSLPERSSSRTALSRP